jgi:hypothetical protein
MYDMRKEKEESRRKMGLRQKFSSLNFNGPLPLVINIGILLVHELYIIYYIKYQQYASTEMSRKNDTNRCY